MRRFCLLACALCLLTSSVACAPKPSPETYTPPPRPLLPTTVLVIRDARALVEIAHGENARTRGLMYRTALAPDSGMLFVFDETAPRYFWMYNTYIPLSIAYLDSAGRITDILEMMPLDTTVRYPSSGPARYALEMNSGWFAAKGITPGDTVLGLPR